MLLTLLLLRELCLVFSVRLLFLPFHLLATALDLLLLTLQLRSLLLSLPSDLVFFLLLAAQLSLALPLLARIDLILVFRLRLLFDSFPFLPWRLRRQRLLVLASSRAAPLARLRAALLLPLFLPFSRSLRQIAPGRALLLANGRSRG